MTALQKEGFEINFRGAIGNMHVASVAYAFVNDSDLIETAKNHRETIDHIMYQIQEAVDL